MKAVVNERKRADVKRLTHLLDSNPIIGVVDMEELPARNLSKMRKQLRDKCTILMTKKRLMRLAFSDSKKDLAILDSYLKGMPALLFTDENPFTLFKTLKKAQSPAPIKAGQEAPKDLVVPAGPTEFTPGPMIGELGAMGIKTKVEDGKIAIVEDAKIASEGDIVDEKQAGFLTKMGIEPMRIGLKLVAVYEEGEVLTSSVLDIDEDAFMADLQSAAGMARNLAMDVAWPTQDTIEQLLAVAHMGSSSLAREAGILTSDNVGEMLAKASSAADAINALVPDAPAAEETEVKDSEETKEETPTEAPDAKDPEEEAEAPKEPAEAPGEAPAEKPKEEAPEEKTEEAPEEPVPEDKTNANDAEEKDTETPAEQESDNENQPAEPDNTNKEA